VTPWGQPTRGFKTRNNKRTDKFILNRRVRNKWDVSKKRTVYRRASRRQDRGAERGERKEVIRTWSRRSTILPEFVGHTIAVHNGRKFIRFTSREHGGHKMANSRPRARSRAFGEGCDRKNGEGLRGSNGCFDY